MNALLNWALGDEAESLRRRAADHAIRQEMELHPVERNEFVGPRPAREPEPNLAAKRRNYWRRDAK